MSIPRFDAHCDTLMLDGSLRKGYGHIDLERLARFAPSVQFFAIFNPPGQDTPENYASVRDKFYAMLADNSDLVTFCRSAEDIRKAEAAGKVAAMLSVEGSAMLDCSIEGLRSAYADGVRLVNLTWNASNKLAGSCAEAEKGLSEEGKAFVRECNRLGVGVDLSHASDATFWDTMDCCEKPPLCSHSNARAVWDHRRNMSDEMIRAMIAKKGVIGLNFCPEFLGEGPGLTEVLAQVEHFLELGGEDCLCLGGDLDGIRALPCGWHGVEDMEAFYGSLLRRNYSEALLEKIFYGNLMSYVERVL